MPDPFLGCLSKNTWQLTQNPAMGDSKRGNVHTLQGLKPDQFLDLFLAWENSPDLSVSTPRHIPLLLPATALSRLGKKVLHLQGGGSGPARNRAISQSTQGYQD